MTADMYARDDLQRTKRRSRWVKKLSLLFAVLPLTVGVVEACSSNDGPTLGQPIGSGGATSTTAPSSSGSLPIGCTDGDERGCHVTLGNHGGILDCFDGTQTCANGIWGECGDGTTSQKPVPPGWEPPQGDTPYNLSDAGACVSNPCDPACQDFNEQPDAGPIQPAGTPVAVPGGNINSLPPGLVNKGLVQPCQTGADCQFDHFCANPDEGSCAHDLCQAGVGLANNCSNCVTEVCAASPSCCVANCAHDPCAKGKLLASSCDPTVTTFCATHATCCSTNWTQTCVNQFKAANPLYCAPVYGGTCAHDPCQTGSQLASVCDADVALVCATRPSCCTSTWDSTCLTKLQTLDPFKCTAQHGNWDASCVQKVHDTCGAYCSAAAPACSHNLCDTGDPLDGSCTSCANIVCNGDATQSWLGDSNCCSDTGAWNAACVAEAQQYCDLDCGVCDGWGPGQTDPSCTKYDLTLGVGCANTIPVCNRGTTTAPSGITIKWWPGNSNHIPTCNPVGAPSGTCTTAAKIPPGSCISVSCAFGSGQQEIEVNPGGTGECQCDNNWSEYDSSLTCSPPSCSAAGSQATFKPLDMIVSIDESGSMADPNRWNPAMSAMKTFFQDPTSAGVGTALKFWPENSPANCSSPSCSITNCAALDVGWGALTASPAPTDNQEKLLVASINAHAPGGGTPMYAALGGAEQVAIARQTAQPGHKVVTVFITDGQPNGCAGTTGDIAAEAGNAYTTKGIQTFVIGIAGVAQSTIDQISGAGHGQSFFIASGSNTAQLLLNAMNQIRGNNASCNFPLPNQGQFDPSKASVTYQTGAMMPTTLTHVTAAANCTGTGLEWYFDNNTNPTQISLCTHACGVIQADNTANVQVVIGCPDIYSPSTYTQTYSATCGQGQSVQWGYLAWNATTPSDSSLAFQVAASNDGGTTFGTNHTVATANTVTGNDITILNPAGPCPMSANCPADLYTTVGLPDDRYSTIKLTAKFTPSTDKFSQASLNNWQVTYTCVDTQ